MNFKLIAIDLDGTLLDDDKNVSEENIKTLRKLADKEVEVVIATGRRYWSAKEFINTLDRDIVIISNNGNIVRNIRDDRVIIEKYLDRRDFYNLIKEGRKRSLYPIVHINDYENHRDLLIEYDIHDERYKSYINSSENRHERIDDILNYSEDNILVACYLEKYEKLEDFIKNIKGKYPNRFAYHILTNLKREDCILEIMNPLGSKWKSLEEYALSKDISPEEIISFGDDNNDIEMLKKSGLGIAMKNASEQVKGYSDTISTIDNNNSGVAFELKRIFNLV